MRDAFRLEDPLHKYSRLMIRNKILRVRMLKMKAVKRIFPMKKQLCAKVTMLEGCCEERKLLKMFKKKIKR